MTFDNLNFFFRKMSENNTMRDEFVNFAAKFDVDLSEELSDTELNDVTGGTRARIVIGHGAEGSGDEDR